MKVKVKSILRIMIFGLALLMSSLCVCMTLTPVKKLYAYTTTLGGQDFSFVNTEKDGNGNDSNVIFSVEKVAVVSSNNEVYDENNNENGEIIKDQNGILYSAFDEDFTIKGVGVTTETNKTAIKSVVGRYGDGTAISNQKTYYYANINKLGQISNSYEEKTVIHQGDFVMMENAYSDNDYDGKYKYENTATLGQTGNDVDLQEALMVSLGHYYYENGSIKTATAEVEGTLGKGANIQSIIKMELYKNGVKQDLPGNRQFGNNEYQDFVCFIPQTADSAGYYEFVFTYYYGNVKYEDCKFSFNVVNRIDYDRTLTVDGNTYAASPTISLNGGTEGVEEDVYELGSNNDYPTLMFDYTKYKLNYEHTINNTTTYYDYQLKFQNTVNGRKAHFEVEKTVSGKTTKYVIDLDKYIDFEANKKRVPNNYAVLLFTEIGNYKFTFKYLYDDGSDVHEIENFGDLNELLDKNLSIRGYELKYSKEDYKEAQLKYLTINYSIDKVNLIVPNGYRNGSNPDKNTVLEIVYDLLQNEGERVGAIVNEKVINSDITNTEKAEKLLANIDKIQDGSAGDTEKAQINESLNDLVVLDVEGKSSYVKTNQGSLWLSTNDSYVGNDTFYFYSNAPLTTYEQLIQKTKNMVGEDAGFEYTYQDENQLRDYAFRYTNTTSFNKTGYYLLFVAVDVNRNDAFEIAEGDFYQVFAFQYTSDTISASVKTIDETDDGINDVVEIGAGQYTNKNVIVSWKEPGIFERKITARYYHILNKRYDYSLEAQDEWLNTTPISLTNSKGSEISFVKKGEFATIIVEIFNSGSITRRVFTIDKQDISGVMAYAVEKVTASDNTVYYRIMVNSGADGKQVALTNAITNAMATIHWNSKNSGAKIYGEYSFTPIIKDNTKEIGAVGTAGAWYTTNYRLGETVGSYDIESSSDIVNTRNVLDDQGIYVFNITDAAGNSCKYMFVIDNTESYFKVNGNFVTQESLIFGEDTEYSVGTHKAITVDQVASPKPLQQELFDLIELANDTGSVIDDYKEKNYYIGKDNNINAINKLFTPGYIIVENMAVTAYADVVKEIVDTLSSAKLTETAYKGTISTVNMEEGASSMIRTIFIVGANQTTLIHAKESNSYLKIEINTDNSQLMLYFSNDKLDGLSVDYIKEQYEENRLPTGSDRLDENGVLQGKVIGIKQARATSDDYLVATWKHGTGAFEIEHIKYKYYTRTNNFGSGDNYIFSYMYNSEGVIFNGDNTANKTEDSYIFKDTTGKTAEGLYVVTRTYKTTGLDLGTDVKVKNYYFIVDRQGIIVGDDIGGYIKLQLLENETDFNEFSTIGATPEYFEISGEAVNYNVYLSTNKIPATVHVPVAKYFDGEKGSYYYSGYLQIEVYYRDYTNQLQVTKDGVLADKGNIYRLYKGVADLTNTDLSAGYFPINILPEKTSWSDVILNEQRKYFLANGEGQEGWIYLPGDYIIVIKDFVKTSASQENASNAHVKTIGLRVGEGKLPETPVYSVYDETKDKNNPNREANEYVLTTSDEFVKIELNEYIANETKNPQVDVDYVVVKYFNKNTGRYQDYIVRKYDANSWTITDKPGTYVTDVKQGNKVLSRTIYLDTGIVKDNDGNIISYEKDLKYQITIRYKLSNSGVNEKYKNAYYYYDGRQKVDYYEATYTVVIDREPPKENVNNLIKNDNLVEDYNEENGVDALMEETVLGNKNSGYYYVRRYKAYYQGYKENSKLYAFRVNENTAFNTEDIAKIYYKQFNIEEGILNLPITNWSGYVQFGGDISSVTNYGNVISNTSNVYLEFVEVDKAGNMTQYVIYYTDYITDMTMNLAATIFEENGFKMGTVEFGANAKNNVTIFGIGGNYNAIFTINGTDFKRIDDQLDKYYKFELVNVATGSVRTILSNASSNFVEATGLIKDIENMFIDSGKGVYNFNIYTRLNPEGYTTIVNFYDQNDKVELNAENILKDGADYYYNQSGDLCLNLAGANRVKDDIPYYATKVSIRIDDNEAVEYICSITEHGYSYAGVDVENNLFVLTNGTYLVIITDAFGVTDQYRFVYKDGEISETFYSIWFGDDENNRQEYHNDGYKYYAYSKANISYNSSLYIAEIKYRINNSGFQLIENDGSYHYDDTVIVEFEIVENEGKISVYPYFKNGVGGKVEVQISLINDNLEQEQYYNVIIDTTVGNMYLKSKDGKNIDHFTSVINDDYKNPTGNNIIVVGFATLVMEKVENDYFDYDYKLYELVSEGVDGAEDTYKTYDLNDVDSRGIGADANSLNKFRFVISVYNKSGDYLGNRVYVFTIKEDKNQLYFITTADGEDVGSPTSVFEFAELNSFQLDSVKNSLLRVGETDIALPSSKLPLYINNKNLIVQTAPSSSVHVEIIDYASSVGSWLVLDIGYKLNIYRVYTPTYSLYFGIIKVEETNTLVNLFKVNTVKSDGTNASYSLDVDDKLSFTFADKEQTLTFSQAKNYNSLNTLANKNLIVVDVYYNGTFIESIEMTTVDGFYDYRMVNAGVYKFRFRDLSGNVHKFVGDQESIQIVALSQVVIMMNEAAPINNAYFNNSVEVRVYSPATYDMGSIKIYAKRNGEDYDGFETKQYAYTFTEFGNYRIKIVAKYEDAELEKTINFAILNSNEAHEMIDLNDIKNHKILKVLNNKNENITDEFVALIKKNNMTLSYEDLFKDDNAVKLGISSGKQTFKLTYLVYGDNYPERTVDFAFTLNNDIPYIESSIKAGESTTDKFTITYNAGIIYQQKGDAVLYINDIEVAVISESSSNSISTFTVSFSEHGAGDYYVKLMTRSGYTISSYKLTIKEPLNTSAIIIIVVVSLVVIAVVVSIIVLRHRMKIR